jgi:hypothetical protein
MLCPINFIFVVLRFLRQLNKGVQSPELLLYVYISKPFFDMVTSLFERTESRIASEELTFDPSPQLDEFSTQYLLK